MDSAYSYKIGIESLKQNKLEEEMKFIAVDVSDMKYKNEKLALCWKI